MIRSDAVWNHALSDGSRDVPFYFRTIGTTGEKDFDASGAMCWDLHPEKDSWLQ